MDKNLPQYWGSLEEFEQTPEFLESQSKEFLSPPAQASITEMDRRSFLKIMGAGALFATATACYRRPVEKIIPYVNRPEEVVPGIPDWYASACGECSTGCGILIKTREGRPIKLEGNGLNPLNQGGLCARGQASLLNLYDPQRLKNPIAISKNGSIQNLTFSELDEKIKSQIADLKSKGKKVAILSGALNSPSTSQVIRDFLSVVASSDSSITPEGSHVSYDAMVPEEIGLAHQLSYGEKKVPRYRIDQAKLLVSFGADFLGTWLSPVEFAKGFSKARKIEKDSMLRFVTFESALSLTGTNSDEYFSVKAGDEVLIALALAHELIVANKLSRYANDSQVVQSLSSFDVQAVSQKTGVKAQDLKRVAKALWEAKNHSLILGGPIKAKNGLALQVVVNLLNSVLENEGYTVDSNVSPSNQAVSSYAGLVALIEAMNQEKVGALFIYKSNPIFTLPAELKFADALKKVPLVVSFSDRVDETALVSNYVVSDSHYLESWNDASPQVGIYSIAQPAISPMYQTRSFQDSLIHWADLPYKSWHEYIQAYWKKTVYPVAGAGQSFESFWNESLKKGVVDTLKDRRSASNLSSSLKSFSGGALKGILSDLKQVEGYVLALYPSVALGDGRSANNAWLQELPDPVSKVTWENYLSVSPELAKNLSLVQGDVVRVRGSSFGVELPVYVQPKLNSKTVMVAVGYGRSSVGPVGNGLGVNVFPFQKANKDFVEWSGQSINLEKTSNKTILATTQRHHSMEGRTIIKEITFSGLMAGSALKKEEGEHSKAEENPTMWPPHEYKSYRWGMSIDLSSCVGCNGCMIGCQAENNTPVVGKEQVINGRSMHWIRIDRYFSGSPENPEVAYQPMLCQHCENAPCETVCPTLATLHNDEGLNVQVYNRCVGTRYCANNCPYKVRRFNFFDYMKDMKEPMSLVFNPDVTVRSRGVMEKCTFCIQRIQETKDHAKAEGRRVKGDEVKTACQQSCPADAIVFGDLNDPESSVSKLKESSRGYHVLEDLNVKSQITYLSKVRNKEVAS